MTYSKSTILGLAMALIFPVLALAAGSHDHAHGSHHGATATSAKVTDIGKPGTLGVVGRSITIKMHDNYYEPEKIRVSPGETIRFIIRNEGDFLHEFSIATAAMHIAHQPHMSMMFDHGALEADRINHEIMKSGGHDGHSMAYDYPNSVLVEPGKSAELIWTFPKGGELEFACNIPGHYAVGMTGPVEIK